MKSFLIFTLSFVFSIISLAQEKISNEDIWYSAKLYAKSVPGFNFLKDGRYFTRKVDQKIIKYDILTGEEVGELFNGIVTSIGSFDSYRFSKDQNKILFITEKESIYRHSYRANHYVYDLTTKQITKLFDQGKQMYAHFSPDHNKVGFVFDNNLYYKDLSSGQVTQVTSDGQVNHIINGASDWVYEEEMGITRAFEWSPDSRYLSYYRFDEGHVKEFTLNYYVDELYPIPYTFKFPKVGEQNAIVDLYVYDLASKQSQKVQTGDDKDTYLIKLIWTKDPKKFVVYHFNRHQNHLKLLLVDALSGKTKVLHEEKDKYYVDNYNNLRFLPDGKHFVWTSDRSGFNHIYVYDMRGKVVRQLTKGNWEVTKFLGYDEKRDLVYYQSTEGSPLQRAIYSITLKGKKKTKMSKQKGWNEFAFSPTFDYYTASYSTINTPPVHAIYDHSGKRIRLLEDNRPIRNQIKIHGGTNVEFFDFETSEGTQLNGYMVKPPLYNPKKEYPLFMYLYGGPGDQQVTDEWKGPYYWWFQMLAQKGYVVACVDNRGTGGRGAEFKKMTYMNLGHYETIDQIEAANYLSSLPYIDENRTGIYGWSYGGYMSSLCILKGNEVFEMAIAVAPVTNWKWYDTIYTERFMRTQKENPKGYADNSPIYFADRLKGDYLLVHGLADDNVHFQHAAEMNRALVNANKQYDTYIYTNKNHGIYGGPTRLHLFNKMTQYIEEKL